MPTQDAHRILFSKFIQYRFSAQTPIPVVISRSAVICTRYISPSFNTLHYFCLRTPICNTICECCSIEKNRCTFFIVYLGKHKFGEKRRKSAITFLQFFSSPRSISSMKGQRAAGDENLRKKKLFASYLIEELQP